MTDEQDQVTVEIKYKDVQQKISGNPEAAWLLLDKFFAELFPSFETAKKLTLVVDLQRLAKDSEDIIAFAEEGPCILIPRNKLTDTEALTLLLLANYIGNRLDKITNEGLSKKELQSKLGKDAKIASTRLGELVRNETVKKTADDKFVITTFGLLQAQKDLLPRIRARSNIPP